MSKSRVTQNLIQYQNPIKTNHDSRALCAGRYDEEDGRRRVGDKVGPFSCSSYLFIIYICRRRQGKVPFKMSIFFCLLFSCLRDLVFFCLSSKWAGAGQLLELESYREAVQGNVDPAVLFAPPEAVEQAVKDVVAKAGPTGHILNLGHGEGSRVFSFLFFVQRRKRDRAQLFIVLFFSVFFLFFSLTQHQSRLQRNPPNRPLGAKRKTIRTGAASNAYTSLFLTKKLIAQGSERFFVFNTFG